MRVRAKVTKIRTEVAQLWRASCMFRNAECLATPQIYHLFPGVARVITSFSDVRASFIGGGDWAVRSIHSEHIVSSLLVIKNCKKDLFI